MIFGVLVGISDLASNQADLLIWILTVRQIGIYLSFRKKVRDNTINMCNNTLANCLSYCIYRIYNNENTVRQTAHIHCHRAILFKTGAYQHSI